MPDLPWFVHLRANFWTGEEGRYRRGSPFIFAGVSLSPGLGVCAGSKGQGPQQSLQRLGGLKPAVVVPDVVWFFKIKEKTKSY